MYSTTIGNLVPGSSDKRLRGNGEKLTYSPVGCNGLCLAGVYFPSFSGGRGPLSDGPGSGRNILYMSKDIYGL